MGKLKDLRKKVEDGTATDEEKVELEELEEDIKDESTNEANEVDEGIVTEEDKKWAKSLAKSFMSHTSSLKKALDAEMEEVNRVNVAPENKVVEDTAKDISGVKARLKALAMSMKYKKASAEEVDEYNTLHQEWKKNWFKALFTEDKQKLQVMAEGTNDIGGYLLRTEWAQEIIYDIRQKANIRSRSREFPITGKTFYYDSLISRPKMYWRGELASKSTTTAQFNQASLTPYSVAAIIGISEELQEDATIGVGSGGVVDLLQSLMVEALAEEEDTKFLVGTGSSQPTGLSTYTPNKTVNAGGLLSFTHINTCYLGLPQPIRQNGVWIMSTKSVGVISNLVDSQNRPLYSDTLLVDGLATLKGRPIIEFDMAGKTIFFVDLSKYWIATKGAISTMISREATVASNSAFEKNLIWLRVEERIDGELVNTQALATITNV